MFEQKFGFSVVVFLFTCGNFTLIFTVFFRFFESDFFSKCFPNPFTAILGPSFLFELNFHFSLAFFCVHMLHFKIDFLFFSFFLSDFFKNIFSINS